MLDIFFQLIARNAAYLSCLSLVAWILLKLRGAFPFEIAGCYAVGAYAYYSLVDSYLWHPIPSLILSVVGSLMALALAHGLQKIVDIQFEIFGIIYSLSILVVFSFITQASPISTLYLGQKLMWLSVAALVVSISALTWLTKTPGGARIRLGKEMHWISEAWLGSPKIPSCLLLLIGVFSWAPVIAIPCSTTGVAASTIFLDVSIAVFIAKAIALKHPSYLVIVSSVSATLRTVTEFVVAGSLGTIFGNTLLIAILLLVTSLRGVNRQD